MDGSYMIVFVALETFSSIRNLVIGDLGVWRNIE